MIRRGKDTAPHTRFTSARSWPLLTIHGSMFRRAEAFHNVEQPMHDLRQLVEKSHPLLRSRVACWLWRGGACRPESWHWRALRWWTRGRPRGRAASLSFLVPRSHLTVADLLSEGPG